MQSLRIGCFTKDKLHKILNHVKVIKTYQKIFSASFESARTPCKRDRFSSEEASKKYVESFERYRVWTKSGKLFSSDIKATLTKFAPTLKELMFL